MNKDGNEMGILSTTTYSNLTFALASHCSFCLKLSNSLGRKKCLGLSHRMLPSNHIIFFQIILKNNILLEYISSVNVLCIQNNLI